jgi:hypothetical protein
LPSLEGEEKRGEKKKKEKLEKGRRDVRGRG